MCGRLTWTRRDCYLGVTSRELVKEQAVGPFQKGAALKVWGKCNYLERALDIGCLQVRDASGWRQPAGLGGGSTAESREPRAAGRGR